jgi:YjbE family integral membrane protein
MVDIFDSGAWTAAFADLWTDMHLSSFWIAVLQIIWINILLSGDNAVVIALACRNLSKNVRMWGMALGAGVAILLRIVFTLIVASLMSLPYLKIVGGLALFYIAVKLLVPDDDDGEDSVYASRKLWKAVRVIALADVIMSLDNVIAIAATAKGHVALFVFGLAISIPLIVAGARAVMELLTHFPVLVWAGGGLLGWITGQVIATDPVIRSYLVQHYGEHTAVSVEYATAALGAVLVVAIGWAWRRNRESKSKLDTAG